LGTKPICSSTSILMSGAHTDGGYWILMYVVLILIIPSVA
jgi:hypothetical protein